MRSDHPKQSTSSWSWNTNVHTNRYPTDCLMELCWTSPVMMAKLKSMSLTLNGRTSWSTSTIWLALIFVWMMPAVFRAPSAESSCGTKERSPVRSGSTAWWQIDQIHILALPQVWSPEERKVGYVASSAACANLCPAIQTLDKSNRCVWSPQRSEQCWQGRGHWSSSAWPAGKKTSDIRQVIQLNKIWS